MASKRELYKQLKQQKLFSKFCLVVTSAFMKEGNPRELANRYLYDIESLDPYSLLASVKAWDIKLFLKEDCKVKAVVL